MPDWQPLLRQRLGRLGLSPQGEADVFDELGAHFEQLYEEAVLAGDTPQQALERATAQVPDWKRFRRDLRSSKEDPMNHRARVFWLPGLFSCLLGFSLLSVMARAGLRPRFIWLAPTMGVAFYVPWFVALVLVGALTAWWSRRAGGAVRERLEAVLLPSICTTVLFVIVFVFSLFFERHMPADKLLVAWLVTLLAWAVLPGAGLLLGALPFLGSMPARNHPAAAKG